jgi:penicillin-binding protein 1A
MRRVFSALFSLLAALLRLVAWTAFALAVLAGIVVFALWTELSDDLPPVDELAGYRPPAATLVYSNDGTLIGEFFDERRYPIAVSDIPDRVKNAFFAAEDSAFETHGGVDFLAIGRAFLANLQQDRIVQGGSTITQQVVKQLLLSPERSYERKLKEVILAQQIEIALTKEKILELYLNEIYFGAGAYGITAAAETYFGVAPGDLSIAQSALLAGLPKAPSRYNPYTRPDSAIARQRYVLRRMRTEGMISDAEYRQARAETLDFAGRRIETYAVAPWYLEHVRRLLEERFGEGFAARGLRVHTAVDLDWQRSAQKAIDEGLTRVETTWRLPVTLGNLSDGEVESYLRGQRAARPRNRPQNAVVTKVIQAGKNAGLEIRTPWEAGFIPAERLIAARGPVPTRNFSRGDLIAVDTLDETRDGIALYALDGDPRVEGALVAIEPETGLVKAMVGGTDYERSEFNRATLARRQPGSAMKPLVFAAGIDRGFSPEALFLDAPISLPNGARGLWSPRNFKDEYYGTVTLRQALMKSMNSVTVRLAQAVGIEPLRDYLDIFGLKARLPRQMAIVLGSREVTPLEMARAYGIFATGGRRFEPVFITRITDADGNTVEFADSEARPLPVMQPETARVMTDMLASVVQTGTGGSARALGRPAAGKTGTTNESRDAWFVGFTPEVVATVWLGYDSSRPLGKRVTGGSAAAPIWTAFVQDILTDLPIRAFEPPERPVPILSPPLRPIYIAPVEVSEEDESEPAGGEVPSEEDPAPLEPGALDPAPEPPKAPRYFEFDGAGDDAPRIEPHPADPRYLGLAPARTLSGQPDAKMPRGGIDPWRPAPGMPGVLPGRPGATRPPPDRFQPGAAPRTPPPTTGTSAPMVPPPTAGTSAPMVPPPTAGTSAPTTGTSAPMFPPPTAGSGVGAAPEVPSINIPRAEVPGNDRPLQPSEAYGSDPPIQPAEAYGSDPPIQPAEAYGSDPPIQPAEAYGSDPPIQPAEAYESDPPIPPAEAYGSDPPIPPADEVGRRWPEAVGTSR